MEQRNLYFLTFLRDAVTGVCSPEAMALAKDMDRSAQDQVLELARLHNLFPLLAQQLMRLHPPGLEAAALRACTVEALVRQTMATQSLLTLTRALEQASVPALVIKGAVCRSLYPSPDLRPSSDEDILIPPESQSAAEAVLEALGYRLAKEEENPDDPVRTWYTDRLRVELHRSLCGDLTIARQRVEPWFDGCFSRRIVWNVGEGEVLTLGIQDHILYLLLHFYKHFLAGGVGIRQLCDICLFVSRFGGEIDWTKLWKVLEQLSLDCLAWNMLDLGVQYLGLDPQAVLQPPHMPEADSGALLLDMLDAGVFGASTMERKHSSHMTIQAASAQSRRAGTLWTALFPPARSLQGRFPYLRRWPWLLPAAWCARGFGYLREGKDAGGRAATAARIGRQRLELLEQYGLLDRKA